MVRGYSGEQGRREPRWWPWLQEGNSREMRDVRMTEGRRKVWPWTLGGRGAVTRNQDEDPIVKGGGGHWWSSVCVAGWPCPEGGRRTPCGGEQLGPRGTDSGVTRV